MLDLAYQGVCMKALQWLSSSKRNLCQFPKEVIQEFGYALYVAQQSETYYKTKLFKGYGSNVYEIAIEYNKNAYRVIYIVIASNTISIAHAFQKKSRKGIKTPKQEIDVIKQRLKLLSNMR